MGRGCWNRVNLKDLRRLSMSFPTKKNSLIKPLASLSFYVTTAFSPHPLPNFTLCETWRLLFTVLFRQVRYFNNSANVAIRWAKGKASEEAEQSKGYWIQTIKQITARTDVSGGMNKSELEELSRGEARGRDKGSGGKS